MSLIGADPELFLEKNGEIVIPCGKLGGTKGSPVDIAAGIGLQEDNIMAEFNVVPQSDPYDFAEGIVRAVSAVQSFVRTKLKDKDVRVSSLCEVQVPLASVRDIPTAMEFGCSMEYDGYKRGAAAGAVTPQRFQAGAEEGMVNRFAGGHVHLGYNNPGEVPEFVVACMADLFIGLPSMRFDSQKLRRRLYGQPGRYRPTDYGIEYRTMSNWWVMDGNYALKVGKWSNRLMTFIEETPADVIRGLFKAVPWSSVRRAIILGRYEEAKQVMDAVQRGPGADLVRY